LAERQAEVRRAKVDMAERKAEAARAEAEVARSRAGRTEQGLADEELDSSEDVHATPEIREERPPRDEATPAGGAEIRRDRPG